jgi:Gpi18-like mannosyltransferase
MYKQHNLKQILWILSAWAISRLTLLFIGWGANLRIPGGNPSQPWPMPNEPLLFTMWDRYDSQWYLAIVQHGYNIPINTHYSPQAFFPLYPMLIGLVERLTGIPPVIIGVILSNLFFIVGLLFLNQLVEQRFGSEVAHTTVLFLILFPTAFFFSAIYTESLFLMGTVIAFWAADRNRWWLAGIGGAIATLTRNLGIMLIIPLILLVWEQYSKRAWRKCIPLLLIPGAFALWALFLWWNTNDPLRFVHAESGWGRVLQPPWMGIAMAFYRIVTPAPPFIWSKNIYISAWKPQFAPFYSLIDGVSALAGISLSLLGRHYGLPWSWIIFALICVLIPMSAPTLHSMTPLASMSRYIVIIFPIMVTLAQMVKDRPNLKVALMIALPMIQAFFFILFTTWNWIA